MTQETARHFAQNLLSRVRGAEKLMGSAGVDYASIQIGSDGSIRIWVSKEMANTDVLSASFDNYLDHNSVNDGKLAICDRYGNEVA